MKLSALGLGLATCLLSASTNAAAREDSQARPFARHTVAPAFAIGLGFSREVTSIQLGLGFAYFLADGFALGLDVSDTLLVYGSTFRARYPGIEKRLPNNLVHVIPKLQYVFYRSPRFAPYVLAGVGPVFANHRALANATLAQWIASVGAFIGLGGPVFFDLAVVFSGMVPVDRCNALFRVETANAVVSSNSMCAFTFSPRIGLTLAF